VHLKIAGVGVEPTQSLMKETTGDEPVPATLLNVLQSGSGSGYLSTYAHLQPRGYEPRETSFLYSAINF